MGNKMARRPLLLPIESDTPLGTDGIHSKKADIVSCFFEFLAWIAQSKHCISVPHLATGKRVVILHTLSHERCGMESSLV
jgi:hypothetical protein